MTLIVPLSAEAFIESLDATYGIPMAMVSPSQAFPQKLAWTMHLALNWLHQTF